MSYEKRAQHTKLEKKLVKYNQKINLSKKEMIESSAVFLDQLKKRKLVSISENFEFMDQSTLQIEKIIKEERNILVQKAIQQLPTRQKTALILCFLEGYSNKEVATILETTEKAVQSLLLRAKDFLKRQIDITKL